MLYVVDSIDLKKGEKMHINKKIFITLFVGLFVGRVIIAQDNADLIQDLRSRVRDYATILDGRKCPALEDIIENALRNLQIVTSRDTADKINRVFTTFEKKYYRQFSLERHRTELINRIQNISTYEDELLLEWQHNSINALENPEIQTEAELDTILVNSMQLYNPVKRDFDERQVLGFAQLQIENFKNAVNDIPVLQGLIETTKLHIKKLKENYISNAAEYDADIRKSILEDLVNTIEKITKHEKLINEICNTLEGKIYTLRRSNEYKSNTEFAPIANSLIEEIYKIMESPLSYSIGSEYIDDVEILGSVDDIQTKVADFERSIRQFIMIDGRAFTKKEEVLAYLKTFIDQIRDDIKNRADEANVYELMADAVEQKIKPKLEEFKQKWPK